MIAAPRAERACSSTDRKVVTQAATFLWLAMSMDPGNDEASPEALP
jgi:hypothetical protein